MSPEQMVLEREHIDCHKKVDATLQILQAEVKSNEKSAMERAVRLETKLEKISELLLEGSSSINSRLAVFESSHSKINEQIGRLYVEYQGHSIRAQQHEVAIGIQKEQIHELKMQADKYQAIANQWKLAMIVSLMGFGLSMISMWVSKH